MNFREVLGSQNILLSFPIAEESLIEHMKKAQAIDLEEHGKKIEEYVKNPTPVPGIGLASAKRSFTIDPTHTVSENIALDDGTIIAKAGTKINPLDKVDLPGLLFFDGADPRQVAWARTFPEDFKWILVKGSPIDLESREERPVYFDQFGAYTARFQIQNIPAKVTQQGRVLLVEELPTP